MHKACNPGASVAAGGERLFGETGSFWAPTVLINVPPWPEMPFGGVKELGYGSEGGVCWKQQGRRTPIHG